jgi:predicted RNA-binding protein with RPS1 domain
VEGRPSCPRSATTSSWSSDRFEANESLYICSRPGAVQKADWELLEPGQIVEARVTGANKGGLELEVAGHRAFMPASQVSLDHIADLSPFIGEKLTCQVTKVDRAGRGNIVLSRRDMLVVERRGEARKLREHAPGGPDASRASSARSCPSARSSTSAASTASSTSPTSPTTASTRSRRRRRQGRRHRHASRSSSSTGRRTASRWASSSSQADPFKAAGDSVKAGETVTGRVTKILEFGAFVEVAPGVEGLVHISELEWRRVEKVEEVLRPDEVVSVRVLKIDPESRRISLSVKQTKARPEGAPSEGEQRAPAKRPKGIQDRSGFRRGPERDNRSPDEILKETPAMRRLREKFGAQDGFKGGLG